MTAFMLHKKPKIKLKFVTLDKESNMSTLWRREEFLKTCSKEDLAEKAQDIQVTLPIKKKSGDTVQLRSSGFLRKSFLGQANGLSEVAIDEVLQIT